MDDVFPRRVFVDSMRAISVETGETVWVYEQRAATMSLMATAGDLVFGGDTNGRFRTLDQETGEVLWEINLGSGVTGFPVTYAVDGTRYVAVSTGTSITTAAFGMLTRSSVRARAITSSYSRCRESQRVGQCARGPDRRAELWRRTEMSRSGRAPIAFVLVSGPRGG